MKRPREKLCLASKWARISCDIIEKQASEGARVANSMIDGTQSPAELDQAVRELLDILRTLQDEMTQLERNTGAIGASSMTLLVEAGVLPA